MYHNDDNSIFFHLHLSSIMYWSAATGCLAMYRDAMCNNYAFVLMFCK